MKRIIEICSKNAPVQNDVVKLRLRGRGSGFKEGPRQEESKEALHLCISSRFYDKYQMASNFVQELILNVYEEYRKFCEKHKKDLRSTNGGGVLQIRKNETVTGRRGQIQPMPSTY